MADEQNDIDIVVSVKDAQIKASTERIRSFAKQAADDVAAENRRMGEAVQRMSREVNGSLGETVAGFRTLGATAQRELADTGKHTVTAKSMIAAMVAESTSKLDVGSEAWQRYGAGATQAGSTVSRASTFIASTLGGLAGSLVANLSIQPLVNFGAMVLDLGAKAKSAADTLGTSTTVAQEFVYAAEQSGVSLGVIAGGMSAMNSRLTEGKAATRAALKDLGLDLNQLRAMRPEDSFTAIGESIRAIPDPMRQSARAVDLLGESGARALPMLREGFAKLRQEAQETGRVLSEEDVRALDEFSKRFDGAMQTLKVSAATTAIAIGDSLTSGWDRFVDAVRAGIQSGPMAFGAGFVGEVMGQRLAGRDPVDAAIARAGRMDAALGIKPNVAIGPTDEELRVREAAIKRYGETVSAVVDKITGAAAQKDVRLLQDALNRLTADQRTNGDVVRRLLEPYEKLRQQVKLLPSELERVRSDFQKPLPARNLFETTRTEIVQIGDTIREVTSSFPKIVVPPGFDNWAIGAKNNLMGLRKDGLLPVSQSFAQVIPQAAVFGDAIDTTGVRSKNLSRDLKEVKGELFDSSTATNALAQSLSQLAQISPLDGWMRDVAEFINLLNVAGQAGSQLGSVFGGAKFGTGANAQTLNFAGFRDSNGKFTGSSVASGSVAAVTAGIRAYG